MILDMTNSSVPQRIHVSQYDNQLQILEFELWDGDVAYEMPSGASVQIQGTKPDGNGFAYDCTYASNVVSADIRQQMTAVHGEVECEIVVFVGTKRKGSANFTLVVEESALDENTDISDTEIPAIIELAQEQVYESEAWSKGTKNGVPVASTDEQYENNAKYYAEQAEQTDIGQVNNEIADIVNVYGAKNLLAYPYCSVTGTFSGITFTDNGDGTITANGTSTAIINYSLHTRNVGKTNDFIIKNGTYIVTGTPIVQGNYGIGIDVTKNGTGVNLGTEYGNGLTVTFDGSDNTPSGYSNVQVRIFIRENTTLNNVIFKPMIRCASISDGTWQPYTLTNKDLTYNNKTVTGRNLITCPYYNTSSYTTNGITFTINADGSITANGTATGVVNYSVVRGIKLKGTYTLSGCINGSSTTYEMTLAIPGVGNLNPRQFNEPVTYNNLNGEYFVNFIARQGAVLNNLTFKPMLEEGITAHAYEPTTETALTMRNSIAPVEDGATASQTRNAGSYIMRKGQLWKVTTTIASGSAITEGSNITQTTIAEQLQLLFNSISQ